MALSRRFATSSRAFAMLPLTCDSYSVADFLAKVFQSYKATVKERGVVFGVRGEPWLVANAGGPFLAISFATLSGPLQTRAQ